MNAREHAERQIAVTRAAMAQAGADESQHFAYQEAAYYAMEG